MSFLMVVSNKTPDNSVTSQDLSTHMVLIIDKNNDAMKSHDIIPLFEVFLRQTLKFHETKH